MAPPAADVDIQPALAVGDVPVKKLGGHSSASRLAGALTYSGSLDSYEQFDVTNVIGREFPALQLSEILHDDTKIRDLAILSMFTRLRFQLDTSLTGSQSPNGALSSSAARISALMTKSSSASASVS